MLGRANDCEWCMFQSVCASARVAWYAGLLAASLGKKAAEGRVRGQALILAKKGFFRAQSWFSWGLGFGKQIIPISVHFFNYAHSVFGYVSLPGFI